jgi:LemA protein
MSSTVLILVVLGALALFLVVLYNRLVALRQTRNNAFADIDVQLKLRHDLVPNLVETVKGYATHEKELFERVTQTRTEAMNASGVNDKIRAEGAFGHALHNLFAVAENYPNLRASENFQRLQSELADVENKIAAARRFFNNATGEFNTAVQQFPANLLAGKFGFGIEPFFDLGEEERTKLGAPPQVKFQ